MTDALKNIAHLESYDVVTIIVKHTDDSETFIIHKELLYSSSEYFPAAFEKGFAEGGSKSLLLEDLHLSTFSFFISWLYTGKLVEELRHDEWLIRLSVMADRFRIHGLRKVAMERLYDIQEEALVPEFAAVKLAFESLPQSAPERVFSIGCYAYRFDRQVHGELSKADLTVSSAFWLGFALKARKVAQSDSKKIPSLETYLNGDPKEVDVVDC